MGATQTHLSSADPEGGGGGGGTGGLKITSYMGFYGE